MPNAEQMADALAPTLAAELGEEQLFAQVYPRSPVGEELFAAVQTALEEQANWRQLTSARTRVGGQSYEGPIREALEVGPDVLVLDYYGLDGANALSTARELVSGDTEVVTPLYNRPMAANSGGAIEGVLGTVTWDVSVTESVSPAFREAWRGAYADDGRIGTEPSGVAHVAYVQLLGYAAAVERAGTFEPPAVVDALEDHSYDVGLGTETMRACDHRAERPVPVVRGLPAGEQSDGRYFELVDVETGVTYGCDEGPASECSL
jgi:ABC-type branched-subunit amino acid transport system substrate-binding protein